MLFVKNWYKVKEYNNIEKINKQSKNDIINYK